MNTSRPAIPFSRRPRFTLEALGDPSVEEPRSAMAEAQDDYDEDLFADLYARFLVNLRFKCADVKMYDRYEGDDADVKTESKPEVSTSNPVDPPTTSNVPTQSIESGNGAEPDLDDERHTYGENIYGDENSGNQKQEHDIPKPVVNEHGFAGTVGIKEDGYV